MRLHTMAETRQSVSTISQFGGLNRNMRNMDGEFYDSLNMSDNLFPALTTHEVGGEYPGPAQNPTMISAAIAVGNQLYAVTDKSVIMYGFTDGKLNGVTSIAPNILDTPTVETLAKRHLVMMGAYLLIFPDKVYLNLADVTDYGPIEKGLTSATLRTYTTGAFFSVAQKDGTDISSITFSATAPSSPTDGQYWGDTSDPDNVQLQKYNGSSKTWVLQDSFVKIKGAGLTHSTVGGDASANLEEGDVIHISGITTGNNDRMLGNLDGYYKIEKAYKDETSGTEGQNDYVLIRYMMSSVSASVTSTTALDDIDISVKMPDGIQFVFESNNRLWGCYHGMGDDGTIINEIYASALGSFRNWFLYEGISTDSYAVSVGSGGDFTGACAYGGYLLFFKENCVHKIYGQMPSEYQAQMILLDGVQTNAEKTLTVMDGLLYYKSPNGVCVFDGVQPTLISKDAFGEKTYTEVVKFTEDSKTYICGPCAATIRGKYYINLYDASEEKWYIYSYDKSKGIWHKEDGFRGESAYTPSAGPTAVKHMVAVNGDIFGCYSSDDDGVQTGMSPLAVLLGYVLPTDEDSCEWYAETGLIEAVSPDSTLFKQP